MTRQVTLAARGASPAAFDRRCIAGLGATRDLHHGLPGILAVVLVAATACGGMMDFGKLSAAK